MIVCARWESPYIVEWIEYHKAIGFDHIYLYCNDDDPAHLYGQIIPYVETKNPYITFHYFPFQGQQFHMYMHCMRNYLNESEWIIFLDIDEFLCLKKFDDIQAFLNEIPEHWDSVYFNWLFFGNSGFEDRPSGSVLLNYTKRERLIHQSTKTLTRTKKIDISKIKRKIYIWHDWEEVMGEDFKKFNVLGHPMDKVFGTDGGKSYIEQDKIQSKIYENSIIHHYAFRSAKDFSIRIKRGILGDFGGQTIWRDLKEHGKAQEVLDRLNEVSDTYLANYWRDRLRLAYSSSVVPIKRGINIAPGKRTNQSSVSEWSRHRNAREDSAGAVSGVITGSYQFHTDFQDRPWWSIEFEEPTEVREIRIFNRCDDPNCAARLENFVVQYTVDNTEWCSLYEKHGGEIIGGADGRPLIVEVRNSVKPLAIRIMILGSNCLHLDQVEIYST